MRLLFIDDDYEFLELLGEIMKEEGFEPCFSESGQEALHQIKSEKFDLCILDLMLPDINGIDMLTAIRNISDIPVLILSAKSDPFDRILGLEMGADDYLVKPFEPWELAARIRAILRRSEAKQKRPIA